MLLTSDRSGLAELHTLIENSIQRVTLKRDEFEAKLGVRSCLEDDEDNERFAFRGSLSKVCLKRKSLRASVRNWFDKLGRKQETTTRSIGSNTTCPKELYKIYVDKLRSDEKLPDNHVIETDWSEELRGYLVECRTPEALALYRGGILFDGEIGSSENKYEAKTPILQAAAYLYFQLWWFRAIQGKSMDRSYGFAMSLTGQQDIEVTLLCLEKPDLCAVAGRYTLYEYNQRYKLDDKNVFSELGQFIFSVENHLPNPFDMASLANNSPGCAMLLPFKPNESLGLEVVSTLNGSLVIRTTSQAARDLAEKRSDQETDEGELAWLEQLANDGDESSSLWYIKYKTPASFGPFYDTAEIAINGSRRILQRKMAKQAMSSQQAAVAREWLRMHPIDAFVSLGRSISVARGMGTMFVGPSQLTWERFKHEILSLMYRTLVLQDMCSLIHGDVHEGNVLFNEEAESGNRLVLIDWDEALRKQPCYRKTTTDEEQARYPSGLVSFPEQYTKQQLIHLFQHYLRSLYPQELTDAIERCGCVAYTIGAKEEGGDLVASIDYRFNRLTQFLEVSL